MQIILRKEKAKKWFVLNDELLNNQDFCRILLQHEENIVDSERPLAQLVIRGWDLEAVA